MSPKRQERCGNAAAPVAIPPKTELGCALIRNSRQRWRGYPVLPDGRAFTLIQRGDFAVLGAAAFADDLISALTHVCNCLTCSQRCVPPPRPTGLSVRRTRGLLGDSVLPEATGSRSTSRNGQITGCHHTRPAMNGEDSTTRCPDGTRSLIRLLIVSDVRLYRNGLAAALLQRPHVQVVGSVAFRLEALHRIRYVQPDVRCSLTSARRRTWRCCESSPSDSRVRIVGLAVYEVEEEIIACAKIGMHAYASPDTTIDELIAILESVMRGESYCSPATAALARRISGAVERAPANDLTGRERDIVRLKIERDCPTRRSLESSHQAANGQASRAQHLEEAACASSRRGSRPSPAFRAHFIRMSVCAPIHRDHQS